MSVSSSRVARVRVREMAVVGRRVVRARSASVSGGAIVLPLA